uniref:KH domain-containing protein n=1 Tax=Panagrellus redivivus TaxID=6233 RepID=A0A7E4WD02_PANRE
MGEPLIELTQTQTGMSSTPKSISPNFNGANGHIDLNGSHSSASSVHNDSLAGSNSSTSVPLHTDGSVPKANKAPATVDYLTQLLTDKKQLAAFPNVFVHLERLVDEEINRVRVHLFQFEFTRDPMALPEPCGEIITKQEKVFVPQKEHPEYNFVGRILGPRGMTAKQLEAETSCKIMVRGKGSMRDKKKEEANRGKPNWEHLNEELHVLIQCEDTANRVDIKIAQAVNQVHKLLVPSPEGEDELKKKQLMELAIINGTFRNGHQGGAASAAAKNNQLLLENQARLLAGNQTITSINNAIRSPALAGTPFIMQSSAAANQRLPNLQQNALLQQLGLSAANLGQAAVQQGQDYQQLLLSQGLQYDANALALQQQQQQLAAFFAQNGVDYAAALDPNAAAVAAAAAGGQLLIRH